MFEVNVFSGMRPALASHLLERGQAETAVNCLLDSGELRPLSGPLKVESIQGNAGTIFHYKDKWLSWPSRVILLDGPIAGDEKKRVYGTDDEGAFLFCNDDEFEKSSLKTRYALGVPSPESVPLVSVSGTGIEDKDIISRVYVYTLVSDLWEEGPPSAPSAVVDVQEGQTVNVSGLSSVAEGFRPISKIRIYRTVTGTEKAEFQFVTELDAGTVSFTDSVADLDTGEVMVSRYWNPAPQKLQGLTALPGNMFAGFKGNEVFISEPGYPYAWPDSYGMSVPHEIVAMESTGNTLVVLTRANVHIITVDDPNLSVPDRLGGYLPCTSAAGVVASPSGVIFPSLDGLYLVQPGSVPQNITAGIFTEKDWRKLKPDSFNAAWHAGQYICFHEPGAGFIFDPSSKLLTKLGFHCTALSVEPEGRLLHVAYPAGKQTVISLWNGSDFSLRSEWTSGEMRTSDTVNMEAAIVSADYANAPDDSFLDQPLEFSSIGSDMAGSVCLGGDSNSFYRVQRKGEVHFILTVDGKQVYNRQVKTDRPFILPAGYLGTRFQMGIISDIPVSKVDIDPAMGDLL